MVTSKQIPTVDSQNTKKRESEHFSTDDHQFTKTQESKNETRELKNSQKPGMGQ